MVEYLVGVKGLMFEEIAYLLLELGCMLECTGGGNRRNELDRHRCSER